MADPFLTLGRLTMLVLVPLMLLFPLALTLAVPGRPASDSARIGFRGRLLTLVLATLVLLGAWVGLLLTGLRFPGVMMIANFWWAWFFPLWFVLAWPAVALKRANWGASALGAASATDGSVRSASLVNRERRSPVTGWMWAVAAAVFLLVLGAIGSRGLMPFPSGSGSVATPSGQPEAVRAHGGADPRRLDATGKAERSRWARTLAVHAGVCVVLLASLPWGLRRMLTEPEPMVANGAGELSGMYNAQRRQRVLGLFWAWGVLLPGYIGAVLALSVWFPNLGGLWGLVGGVGGAVLGIGGAIYGTRTTVERARIVEVRARLDQAASAAR